MNEGGLAAPRVLEGPHGFGVKCGNLSELLWKVLYKKEKSFKKKKSPLKKKKSPLKKGILKHKNWKKGSAIPFLLAL